MFIITPKRRPALPQPQPQQPYLQVQPSFDATATGCIGDDKGPVRTATACDSCRARKTKCNGQKPCSKCRQRRIICSFSRHPQRDVPVSSAQVALLQQQQRRLYAAVQNMAAVIAGYEDPSRKISPDSFDVPQLLEKYASDHGFYDEEDDFSAPTLDHDIETRAVPTKRKQYQSLDAPILPKRTREQHSDLGLTTGAPMPGSNVTVSKDDEFQFELQPSELWPTAQDNGSYQSMINFLQSMGSASSRPIASPFSLSGTDTGQTSGLPSTDGSSAPSYTMDPTQQFLHLVDWNASLQNLQDSFNPNPSESWPDTNETATRESGPADHNMLG